MTNGETNNDTKRKPVQRLHRVRHPDFLIEEEIGLGAPIKRVTFFLGIKN